MIINKFVFPIKADLKFVEGGIPQGYLTANNINKDMFYVISPAVGNTVLSANFQNNVLNEKPVKVEFIPSSVKVDELVDKNESYYELVKDWNVWQAYMPSKPLEYVAYNRAGEIGISFNFKQFLVPEIPHGLEVKGYVENYTFDPDEVDDGVYVVKVTYYDYGDIEFTYNDLLIKVGNNITRKGAMTQSGNTGTVEYSVDPSVFDSEYEELDPELTGRVLSKLGEVSADVSLLNLKFNNYYTIEEVDGLILDTQAFTYSREVIDSKDSAVLQEAKEYTYPKATIDSKDSVTLNSAKSYADSLVPDLSGIEQDITNLKSNKLDKIWNDIAKQSLTNLSDEFVLNRGGKVYKTTLANMLNNVIPIDIFIVVSELPKVGLPNKIYLVPSDDPELQNNLDEFIWLDNDWERIGNVSVDLSNYYNKEEVDDKDANILQEAKDYADSLEPDLSNLEQEIENLDNNKLDKTTYANDKAIIEQDILDLENNKVNKVEGMGLSTNDFTTAEKNKLSGIQAGAQVNVLDGVQLNGTDVAISSKKSNIVVNKTTVGLGNVDNTSDLNKPISTATQTALNTKVDKVAGKGLSSNDFTTTEKNKLAGIEAGAEVNPTASEIKTLYESNANTNAFTDTEKSQVSGMYNDNYFKGVSLNSTNYVITFTRRDNSTVTIDLPLESVVVSGEYEDDKIILTLQNGSTIEIPLGDLIDGLMSAPSTNKGETTNKTLTYGGTFKVLEIDTNGTIAERVMTLPALPTKAQVGLGNVDNTSDLNKPISTATQTALETKVDKVEGKGLSSNDYTTADKNKLSGIQAGAQVNVLDGVQLNGTDVAISSKKSNIVVNKTTVGLGNVPNVDTTNPANITQNATHRFVSDTEKSTWNGKQNALGFTPENVANKVTTITSSSTNTQYPTAKAVYDMIGDIESALNSILGV